MTIKEIEDTKDQLIRDLGKLESNMSLKKDCCYIPDTRILYMQFELMIYDLRKQIRDFKYE